LYNQFEDRKTRLFAETNNVHRTETWRHYKCSRNFVVDSALRSDDHVSRLCRVLCVAIWHVNMH